MNECMPVKMCACMGPIGDDPYCPCGMDQRGFVATNAWTPEKLAELDRVLDEYELKEDGEKS